MRQKRKEFIATAMIWAMVIACGGYISWKINPDPIKQAMAAIQEKAKQVSVKCAGAVLSQALPALSFSFYEEEGLDGSKKITDQADPSYSEGLWESS